MSVTPFFCDDLSTCLPRTAHVVWQVTREARLARHRGVGCSGPAPYGPADPRATRRRPGCENAECTDLFLDVWLHAHSAMHSKIAGAVGGGSATNPFGYLVTAARHRLSELHRRSRVERGGVAKPQRTDGTVGRVSRTIDDPWRVNVFRFLLAYAANGDVGGTTNWPVDLLTERKNLWDGGNRTVGSATARAELRRDVESVLALVRSIAGHAWLHDAMLVPMASRGVVPLHEVVDEVERREHPRDEGLLLESARAVLDEMLRRVGDGENPSSALLAAVSERMEDCRTAPPWAALAGDELAIRRLAKDLLSALRDEERAA